MRAEPWMAKEPTYWLKSGLIPGSTWVKVTKEDWIRAERAAGFRPGYGDGCATGGFGMLSNPIMGTITYDDDQPIN